MFRDEGGEEGGRRVGDAGVDGREDGLDGGVGREGGGPGGDVVLEGVEVPGAVPLLGCLRRGVLCAVCCFRLGTEGGAQGERGAVVLLAGLGVVGEGCAFGARLSIYRT